MEVNEIWKSEFLELLPNSKFIQEGGFNYVFIPEMKLPEGCNPKIVKAMLCITPRDGYDSRLFLSEKVDGCPQRNWNSSIYIVDSTWHGISWKTAPGLTYIEMLMVNLSAFKNE